MRALIVPHAGLAYSGQVAAYGYAQINPDDFDRAIILGPSHHTSLGYCALTTCEKYQCPTINL